MGLQPGGEWMNESNGNVIYIYKTVDSRWWTLINRRFQLTEFTFYTIIAPFMIEVAGGDGAHFSYRALVIKPTSHWINYITSCDESRMYFSTSKLTEETAAQRQLDEAVPAIRPLPPKRAKRIYDYSFSLEILN